MCMVPSTALLLRRTHRLTELCLGRCNLGEDRAPMSSGGCSQGQLYTEGAAAAGQSTRRERSQGTGGESTTHTNVKDLYLP